MKNIIFYLDIAIIDFKFPGVKENKKPKHERRLGYDLQETFGISELGVQGSVCRT
jgi:hypothetical protein